jgi:signal transducer and activator of transcription 5B
LIPRDLDPENPQHEQYVAGLVASLIQELEAKANTMTTEDLFLTKLKLIEAANMFRVSNRRKIYHIILADICSFINIK